MADEGWVELLGKMGGDAVVTEAARICYQSVAKDPDADRRLILRLMTSEPKHNTVFEHAVFSFRVTCPTLIAQRWLRHPFGAFLEASSSSQTDFTEFIWTVNFWSLTRWLGEWLDSTAGPDGNLYAHLILRLVFEAMPISTAAFMPTLPARTIEELERTEPEIMSKAREIYPKKK